MEIMKKFRMKKKGFSNNNININFVEEKIKIKNQKNDHKIKKVIT